MKFLISGLGSIGRRHFRNLLALGERDIILHRTHRATLPDDELAGFPVETDLAKALAQGPDALIVTNPTALHLQVAIPAAEARLPHPDGKAHFPLAGRRGPVGGCPATWRRSVPGGLPISLSPGTATGEKLAGGGAGRGTAIGAGALG
ncbi:MAG: hypothetical protein MUC85_11775 [Anaerolineales bacterium]|nr:hypothetical protein [Anaerolineales bacterium]